MGSEQENVQDHTMLTSSVRGTCNISVCSGLLLEEFTRGRPRAPVADGEWGIVPVNVTSIGKGVCSLRQK